MRIVTWTAHLLLFFTCLEAAARVDDRIAYGAPLLGGYDSELLREWDAGGVHRNRPGARFEKWRINSLGFRGQEVARAKRAGTVRVVCLGQSETFGLYEREGGEWPARLERMVSQANPRVEVINASVVGPGDKTAYLEKYVLPLDPDVVVLYLNVLADAGPTAPPQAAARAAPPPAPPDQDFMTERSRLLPKLRQRLRAVLPAGVANAARAWWLDRKVGRMTAATLGGRPPVDALPPENVWRFERYVRSLVQVVRASGAVPVLATYPTLVNESNRNDYHLQIAQERIWRPECSELGMIDIARRLNDTLRRIARDMAIPLVDIDATIPKNANHFADHVHYTDEGAEVVAAAVLEVLDRGDLATRAGGGRPLSGPARTR